MSSAYQAMNAQGSKGQLRAGRVRHTVTLDGGLFAIIKAAAVANNRSVSEEMAAWLSRYAEAEQERA